MASILWVGRKSSSSLLVFLLLLSLLVDLVTSGASGVYDTFVQTRPKRSPSSFLKAFLAVQHELFPLSIDLERRQKEEQQVRAHSVQNVTPSNQANFTSTRSSRVIENTFGKYRDSPNDSKRQISLSADSATSRGVATVRQNAVSQSAQATSISNLSNQIIISDAGSVNALEPATTGLIRSSAINFHEDYNALQVQGDQRETSGSAALAASDTKKLQNFDLFRTDTEEVGDQTVKSEVVARKIDSWADVVREQATFAKNSSSKSKIYNDHEGGDDSLPHTLKTNSEMINGRLTMLPPSVDSKNVETTNLRIKSTSYINIPNERTNHVMNPEIVVINAIDDNSKSKNSKKANSGISRRRKPSRQQNSPSRLNENNGLLQVFISSLQQIPVIGNVLRASVDPVYRPLINSFLPVAQDRQATDKFEEEVQCFGELGCIVTTIDFYDPIIRPLNLPPDTRSAINTYFTLYTRQNPVGVSLTPGSLFLLPNTTFRARKPSKFIIHGFLDDHNSTWVKEMSRGLLHHGDYNVFTVDWSGGSKVIYHQAVSNIRLVALEVAAIIRRLQLLGQKLSDVHILGHSLGAHTAGYIGEQIPGLGRITGLDPAEPFFQYMPPAVRLDYTDAAFVDVIHTDTDSIVNLAWQLAGYGLEQAVGHVDFYPNGGRQQPGCSSLARIPLTALQEGNGFAEGLDAAEKEAVACNHVRANKLFTASLYGGCSFQAFPCQSYEEFEKAKCFSCLTENGCAKMGISADQWQPQDRKLVKMYLTTSQGPGFCQYHYRLTLDLGDERRQGGSLRGRLTVTFITHDGELREFDLTQDGPLVFKKGTTRTFLLRHSEDLSGSRDALLHWQFEADVFNPLTFCVLFCSAELEVSTVTLTPLDTPGVEPDLVNKSSESESNMADIIMCHKQGHDVIKIRSERTIKISAESFCSAVRARAYGTDATAEESTNSSSLRR